MGVYSADALKMQGAMSGLNSLIDSNQAQVQADQHLIADVNLVNVSIYFEFTIKALMTDSL